ncbi:putative Heat shock protein 70 family [Helianthus annuus]|nr:putative Heat shock protein 70 family [Helianthus annuus]
MLSVQYQSNPKFYTLSFSFYLVLFSVHIFINRFNHKNIVRYLAAGVVHVEIESFFDGLDFSEPLTRAHFEELNDDLFRKTVGPVKKAMEDVGLEKRQIDEIVLVGGIPEFQKFNNSLGITLKERNQTWM